MKIRDRIKEFKRVKASELIPNSRNWRLHPTAQADALRGVLSEVGIADALIVRETENGLELIDGHLRAETLGDEMVPVLVLDVTKEEADKILLTLDPLAGMAEMDEALFRELQDSSDFDSPAVQAMFAEMLKDGAEMGVLGENDVVDKKDRQGASPWDRIEPSDSVRCVIGDIEFGCPKSRAETILISLTGCCERNGTTLREEAGKWLDSCPLPS